MQLIEIKNDLAKVIYSPAVQKLYLADFLIISDNNQNLLAQVIHAESTQKPDSNLAVVKFILCVDKDGIISPYNGYIPLKGASISCIDMDEVAELLKVTKETMPWGVVAAHRETYVSLDVNFLRNRPYIQCDNLQNTAIITNNIVSGLSKNLKKVVIVDFDGIYPHSNAVRLTLAKDLKLPLNFDCLDYIYENDLNDLDLNSRAIVQDILIEVQQYVKSSAEGFIPFGALRAVVEDEYKKSHSPGIVLIRNKLIKYAQQGLFAQLKEEFKIFADTFAQDDVILVDASSVAPIWQKILLNFIVSQVDSECFLAVNLTDKNSDKKTLSKLYNTNKNLSPIVATSYNYPEARFLKSMAKNLVLFMPVEKVNDFAAYNSFLSKLNHDEFIVWGQDTLHMPFILKLDEIENPYVSKKIQNEISKSLDFVLGKNFDKIKPKPEPEIEPVFEPLIQEKEVSASEGIFKSLEMFNGEESEEFQKIEETEDFEAAEYAQEFDEFGQFYDSGRETLPLTGIDEPKEYFSEDILTDLEEESDTDLEQISEFEREQPILHLVPEPEEEIEPSYETASVYDVEPEPVSLFDEPSVPLEPAETDFETESEFGFASAESELIDYENIFTDEDLDLIDEMNSGELNFSNAPVEMKDLQNPAASEPMPVYQQQKPPIPIFDTPVEPKTSGSESFTEGSFVVHQKYGKGVVEKVISYGNKTLCSIQFDKVGRRLLDPNLAELSHS